MKQLSLAETGFLPKAGKQTRKAVFLAEMETVVPWSRLESLIEPFYPKKGNGRPPMPLGTMLRIHFLQQWFGYSDPAMEEALHDVPLLRQFAGLDAFEDVMPDGSTILRFRHLLEKHGLAVAIFAEVNAVLSEKSLSMKRATIDSIVPHLSDELDCIVIDGGSIDGRQDIILEYADHVACWVSEPDSGIYDAWNKGLARASGRYIGFVGADDVLLPDTLGTFLSHIRQQPVIEYWGLKVVFGYMGWRVIGQPWRWDRFRRYMTVAHVGSLHRRYLFDRFGTFDTNFRIVGDYEFLLRLGDNLKAGFINQVTVIMGEDGTSNRNACYAIKETRIAKMRSHATTNLMAFIDQQVALTKHHLRSLIKSPRA